MIDFTVSVTAAEKRRLKEFLGALRTHCEVQMSPHSPWNSRDFESEFRSKLLTHHCFMGAPLLQDSFDSALASAQAHRGGVDPGLQDSGKASRTHTGPLPPVL